MSFKLGITGSMGMGKTTVASIFKKNNIPLWNADETVHAIYKNGKSGYNALVKRFPKLKNRIGIDREQLILMMKKKEITFRKLESLIHPLLIKERKKFIEENKNHPIIVFEIPLLFETNADSWLNAVLIVYCSKNIQTERLLKRKNISQEKINLLVSRQTDVINKTEKAQFLINTEKSFDETTNEVLGVINKIMESLNGKRSST